MSAPGLLGASMEVADLGWRSFVRSKLMVGLGLLVVAPTIMALLIHQYAKGSTAAQDYQAMQVLILSTAVVPLVSLLLGTGALAAEREGGTLAYLFTRPAPRAAVVLGKGFAALALANATVLVATLCVYLASGAPADAQLGGGLAALLLETTALTGVFVLLGTVLARSLYVGLAYAVLVEGILGNVVAARSGVTITYHARNILSEWSARHILSGSDDVLTTLPGPAAQSVVVLLLVAAVALALACVWVERREYGLRDRPKEE